MVLVTHVRKLSCLILSFLSKTLQSYDNIMKLQTKGEKDLLITPFRRYYATRCQPTKYRKTDFSSREPKPVSISIISLINCSLEKGGVLSQACSPHSLPGQSLLPQRQKSS